MGDASGATIFLKRPGRHYIFNLKGGARAKKRNFPIKIFQKLPENAFLACFFKNLPAAQKFWPKQGLFTALQGSRKTNLDDLKKSTKKILKFLKISSPLVKKILNPPLVASYLIWVARIATNWSQFKQVIILTYHIFQNCKKKFLGSRGLMLSSMVFRCFVV